jgi:Ca-activated chloride channel family protein
MAEEVELTVQTNKSVFPSSDTQQLVYVLMEVQPTDVVADVQMPINFSLVLDHSGSMKGEKIENLKEAARLAIDQMTAQDQVSIVVFDDTVSLVAPSQKVTDREGLKDQIESINAQGGTKISKGMKLGLEELAKGASADRVNRMILLTDGETYGDEDQCRKLASQAERQAVPVTALGLGEEWNEKLLDDIAELSDGTVDFIPAGQPEAILETFQREVRSAQGTVVQDAKLILRFVPGVMARAVWRVTPMITKLGYQALSERDVQVNLGSLDREQGQSVLVELLVSPRQPGSYRVAQAEVNYDVLALGVEDEKVRADLLLSFTEDPMEAAENNPYVLNIVEKVTAHKLQTRALDEAAVGNVVGATQKLRAAATRLLSVGEEELAQTAQEEAERLEQGQGLSSGGTKRLRYETRKLVRRDKGEEIA